MDDVVRIIQRPAIRNLDVFVCEESINIEEEADQSKNMERVMLIEYPPRSVADSYL